MIYLDNAATTLRKPEEVYRRMDYVNRRLSVNAGRGSYALAREAAEIIEDTRRLMRKITGAEEVAEVVFTSSATLALNSIIGGIPWRKEDVIYVSPYEHNAVMRTLYGYQRQTGYRIAELPLLSESGEIDLEQTEYLFSQQPPVGLFLTCVSNVTGYILPVRELADMGKQYGSIVVADSAQALGAIPVSAAELPADFLVFAGHKGLHGPFGVGGFLRLTGQKLKNCIFGGTGSDSLNMEMPAGTAGLEPGSPNITAIAGLQAALEDCLSAGTPEKSRKQEKELMERLITGLEALPGVTVYKAPDREHQAGVVSINLEGYQAGETGLLLDEDYGIAVRTGYHCAPLIHKYLKDEAYGGTVRISVDRYTEETDVGALLAAVRELGEASF